MEGKMNFLSLEYFLVIAEEKNFSRAADKLFVSQQSLSEHVKKLEQELGTPLFKRGRSLTLTVAGECLVTGAQEILDAQSRMLQQIAFVTENRRKKITIAVSTFDVPPFLSELLARYKAKYPNYDAVVVKRQVSDIAYNMSGVDLYISFLPLNPNLENIILSQDHFVAIASKELFSQTYGKKWKKLEQELQSHEALSVIRDIPFILLYDKNGILSRDLDHIFKTYHITPRVGFQSENNELNAEMCACGMGVMLAPYDYCIRKFRLDSDEKRNQFGIYPIQTPGLDACIAISYEKGRHLNPAEKHFIELARQYLSNP